MKSLVKKLWIGGIALLALGGCEQEPEVRYVPEDTMIPKGIPIETAEQLASIGLVEEYPLDGEYYLADDIDLAVLWEKEDEDDPDYLWHPIGSTCRECGGPLLPTPPTVGTNRGLQILPLWCENRDCPLSAGPVPQQPFSGSLHGMGKTIAGLKLPRGTEENGYKNMLYMGLFGYIKAAYIHDVTVLVANTAEDRTGYIGSTSTEFPCVGVLAAVASGSRIVDVDIGADEGAGLYVQAGAADVANYNFIGGVIGQGYDTSLRDVASSVLLDVVGANWDAVGGIAGYMTGEIIGATVDKNITVTSAGPTTAVAGICTGATLIQNCTVTMDELSLAVGAASGTNLRAAVAGIGYGTVTDCAVDIDNIKLTADDTGSNVRDLYVGGITATAITSNSGIGESGANPIEGCSVRFDKLEIKKDNNQASFNTYIGGLAGSMSGTTARVSNCSVDGREIDIDIPKGGQRSFMVGGLTGACPNILRSRITGSLKITVNAESAAETASLFVGGLTGSGSLSSGSNVSYSSIPGPLEIVATIGGTSVVNAGGLIGEGIATYSFVGTADNHAKLNVTKTNTEVSTTAVNFAYVGGISGRAVPTTALPFQYNYAFCDVTLETNAAATFAATTSTVNGGQAVGGLIGFPGGTNVPITQNFAAGNVKIIDKSTASGSQARRVYAGGIGGYIYSNAIPALTKCAALNGSVVIDDQNNNSGSTTNVLWRRITNHQGSTDTDIARYDNNITTVTNTPFNHDSLYNGLKKTDGLFIEAVTEDTFFGTEEGQLGWNREVWEWDAASGYPVLKNNKPF
jgi:hypothetical protein